jgi:hypothetical protein
LEKNNVLDLVVGLDREQIKTFQGLVFPVLRILRENIETGQPTMTVNLESLRNNDTKKHIPRQKAGVMLSRSTKGN